MTEEIQPTETVETPVGENIPSGGRDVWLVTGAGRGLGVDIARAALAAGHAVVATARRADSITRVLGEHENLLAVALDVTDPTAAEAAIAATVERFGRLDVLVNNAGSFQAGFFEEMTPEAFRSQIETTLFGPVNVTRAALPQFRSQRSGLVMTISSTAGIASTGDFLTAYAASKFGVEGFMEGLASEIEPLGIRTMLVEPGFFRTELLTEDSTRYPEPTIDDYAERTRQTVTGWKGMNGQQGGDPAKLAQALLTITDQEQSPFRFIAGADALAQAEGKLAERRQQIDAYRDLSSSLALDEATA
jgi:NAD(P)-dependent dehydrogenase (short-subunit alcohol dehydrogenase family)